MCAPVHKFKTITLGHMLTGIYSKQDFLARLNIYAQGDFEPHLQEKLAEILAILLQVFGRATKLVKNGSIGRVLQYTKNVFVGGDKKLQDLVSKLERLCQGEQRLVAAKTLMEVRRTGNAVEGMDMALMETRTSVLNTNTLVNHVSSEIQNLTVEQREFQAEFRLQMQDMKTSSGAGDQGIAHIKKILQPSVHPQDMYESIAKRRVPGTGDWIRNEEALQAWLDKSQGPILRISGSPGNGKSFIAQNIISFLLEQHPQGLSQSSRTSIGYFFFRDTDSDTRSVHRALRDLAFQIYQNDSVYRSYIDSCCHSPHDIASISSAWRTLFRGYNSSPSRSTDTTIFLVLDGVDEAFQDDRKELFEMLSYLTHCKWRLNSDSR